jgi:hypothetical protein
MIRAPGSSDIRPLAESKRGKLRIPDATLPPPATSALRTARHILRAAGGIASESDG